MNQWNFQTDKPTVYQLTNTIETRGPECINYDSKLVNNVLQWSWYKLEELQEVTNAPAAELLAEFWNIGKQWMTGAYIPSLLVFGHFAGSKELQLSIWGENPEHSLEEAQYSASCVKYVPAGWGLLVIEKVKEKRKEAKHFQNILKWLK